MVDRVKNLTSFKDRDDLFDSLCLGASSLGFEFAVFSGIAGDDDASSETGYPFILTSCPLEWRQRYTDLSYHKVDPTVRLAPVTATVMIWDDLRSLAPDFFNEAASFGLRSGLSIPVLLPQRIYLVSFATAKEVGTTRAIQSALEGLAFTFVQEYVRKYPRVLPSIDFNDNTLKVLHMSLAGFTSEVIASSLGMTVHGVSWHLRYAREKLRCQTTLQACGKALSLGLIGL